MNQQIQSFKNVKVELTKELGHDVAGNVISKSVYLFSIGGNDILAPYLIPFQKYLVQNYTLEQYAGFIIGNVSTNVKVSEIVTSIYTILQLNPFLSVLLF